MTSSDKKIVSNSAILIAVRFIQRLMRVALVVLAARILGVQNYGKFAFSLAFTVLFLIIADLGLHQLLIREIARDLNKARVYLGNAILIKIVFTIINLFLVFCVIQFLQKPLDVKHTVYIIAVYQVLTSFNQLFKAVFQAFQEMRYDGYASILQTLLEIILGITILLLGGTYFSLAFMFLVSSLITFFWCLFITLKRFTTISLRLDKKLILYLIKESIPFGINYFFSTMYTYVDTVMLSLMINDTVVGLYNAAYRLIFALLFIGEGVIRAVYPAMSKFFQDSISEFKRLFQKTIKVMFLVGFFIATAITILSEKVILFLYDKEYREAASALRILIWVIPLIFMTNVMTHTLNSANRQRLVAKVVAFAAFFNMGLNFILIPRLEFQGAAIATLSTELFVFMFIYIYLQLKLVKPQILLYIPKILFINTVMAIILYLFIDLHVIFLGFIAVAIQTGLVLLTRVFTKKEIAFIKGVIQPRRKQMKEHVS
jgi:O-antigen/teichoic acid export membrane protein